MSDLPDEINISWHIEDVKSMDGYEDFTDEEAREVLDAAKRNHDANIGINWEVLQIWADEVKEKRGGENRGRQITEEGKQKEEKS